MKFDELYNKVFISEQDDLTGTNTDVAHPDDFNDVDPIPLPEPTEADSETSEPVQHSSNLSEYMEQCEDFANKLQSTKGASLQSIISGLDKPLTPFEGIHDKMKADISSTATALRTIAEKLKNYIIASERNKN